MTVTTGKERKTSKESILTYPNQTAMNTTWHKLPNS